MTQTTCFPTKRCADDQRRRRFWLATGVGLLVAGLWFLPAVNAQTPPSAVQRGEWSPWFQAAHEGDQGRLQALLESGTPIDARDATGRTALHVATFARRYETLRWLLARNADPSVLDHERYDAVTIAAVADDEQGLRDLLAGGASAQLITSRYDGTALIAAAHLGHDGVIRQLIQAKAPLDHVNNLHWTAAIEAVVLGDGGPRHQASLAALIAAGADLKLSDSQGRAPLELARQRGFDAMVRMLEAADSQISKPAR